ncbi:MAG: hypothetical protein P4L79_10540 [Legionella sp.]|uniref:hypothetical protein n=1 Tax=Legionella sp. TaxID=459 RepID=UPI002850A54E|nr:hypothetical protein [Legionella sp.]
MKYETLYTLQDEEIYEPADEKIEQVNKRVRRLKQNHKQKRGEKQKRGWYDEEDND